MTAPTEILDKSGWLLDDLNILINVVHTNEVVWRTTHEHHKNKTLINDVFNSVPPLLKQKRNTDEIAKKWNSLLLQYQREVRTINANTQSGAGRSKKTKSSWHFFECLSFLADRDSPKNTEDLGISNDNNESTNAILQDEVENEQLTEDVVINNGALTSNNAGTVIKTVRKRPLNNKFDATLESVHNIMKDVVHEKKKKRDETDIFGEMVAVKLKRIKTDYSRDSAQSLILGILNDAIKGKYDPPTIPEPEPEGGIGILLDPDEHGVRYVAFIDPVTGAWTSRPAEAAEIPESVERCDAGALNKE